MYDRDVLLGVVPDRSYLNTLNHRVTVSQTGWMTRALSSLCNSSMHRWSLQVCVSLHCPWPLQPSSLPCGVHDPARPREDAGSDRCGPSVHYCPRPESTYRVTTLHFAIVSYYYSSSLQVTHTLGLGTSPRSTEK